MTTYYKAIRTDGTSFHDPFFRWVPKSGPVEGYVVTHPTANVVGTDAAQHLSASVSPGDCTGMEWPCRLLEVEPVGSVIAPSPVILPSKRAALEFRVVRELPATDVFGPQGAHVAAVIERTRQLTADDAQRLVAARGPEWRAAWSAARSAVRVAARFAASEAAWDAAWCSWYDAREDAGDAVGDAAWDVAWDAAGDVVLALTVRDLVTREHYDTLTNSWRATIGPIHPDDY